MKEKDYIDELILNNLDKLNENEPMDGHFGRFEAKLKLQKKKSRFTFNVVWKVAAAIVFVLLISNQAFMYLSPTHQQSLLSVFRTNENTLSSVSEEYEEVEFYYTNAISVGMNQWNSFVAEGLISQEEQEIMNGEITEFETLYKTLQTDLEANPNDERVINAMLAYYQTKLSVINMIVSKLNEVREANVNSGSDLNI